MKNGLAGKISSTSVALGWYCYRKQFAPSQGGSRLFPARVPSQVLEANQSQLNVDYLIHSTPYGATIAWWVEHWPADLVVPDSSPA